ncbi:MAG TPA: hypothetical protein VE221_03835 [Sphingomicrobium sp.]|nr:hypothetical protein [Sphingomicrobium sp.]
MRPSLRFLALAVVGWAGFRLATLGMIPAGFFSIARSEAKAPPAIVPTEFPQVEPVQPAAPAYAATTAVPTSVPAIAVAPAAVQYVQGVIGVPVSMRRGVVYQLPAAAPASASNLPPRLTRLANALPTPEPAFYAQLPPLGDWPLSRIAAMSRPKTQSSTVLPAESMPAALNPRAIDRVQLTMWALLRSQQTGVAGSSSLASGGTLGASQAGARLTYNFTRQIAATLRTTTDVGRRGGEVAAGVRVQPLAGIPLWLTAERRQRLGQFSDGRNDFALFFESGVYQRPMPWRFSLDAYLEGGVVGLRSRDGFIDGGLAFTRPVYKRFSAGFGIWGGAQPGLSRLDAGPRISMQVRHNVRVHFDWRQRLAGNAKPGSGPAVTLAGDF